MSEICKIEITARPEKIDDLKAALNAAGVRGMSVISIMGAGNQKGKTEIYRGNEVSVDLLPKIRVEILCAKSACEGIIQVSQKCLNSGQHGDGKIVVLPVLDVIRIRTNERGEQAL